MKKTKKLLAGLLTAVITFGSSLCGVSVYAAAGDTFEIGGRIVKVGDYFQMGTYYGDPILWRCISVDENGPLFLSDKILCIKCFDSAGYNKIGSHVRGATSSSSEAAIPDGKGNYNPETLYYRYTSGSNYWNDSNIKDWLNSPKPAGEVQWSCGNPPNGETDQYFGEKLYNPYADEAGFLYGFTEKERSAVKEVSQKQILDRFEYRYPNPNAYPLVFDSVVKDVLKNYYFADCEYRNDKMFLLDVAQVHDLYVAFGDYYMAYPTQKAVDNSEYKNDRLNVDRRWSYWLRTPNADANLSVSVRMVYANGIVDSNSAHSGSGGIRPAFYLNTETAAIAGGTGTATYAYVVNGEAPDPVVGYDAVGGKIYFDTSTGTITGCDSTVTKAAIPETIENVKVAAVAKNAFLGCTSLEEVYCTEESPANDINLYPENTKIRFDEYYAPIFGDGDGDGEISVGDAAEVMQKALVSTYKMPIQDKTDDWKKYIDADEDGDISSSDAAFVFQKVLISTFRLPAEKK